MADPNHGNEAVPEAQHEEVVGGDEDEDVDVVGEDQHMNNIFQAAAADLDELVFMPNVDSSDEEDLPLVAAAAAAAAGAAGEGEAAVLAAAGEIPMHDLDEEDTEVRK